MRSIASRHRGDRMCQAGFTLIELIVVIVLLGIMATGAGMLIKRPVEAYSDQLRRQHLVDAAEMALRKIAGDIRSAVPNSIRIVDNGPSSWALEMVNSVDGARYRDEVGGAVSDDTGVLEFNHLFDNQFNILGRLSNLANGDHSGLRVVIYNTGAAALYSNAATNVSPGVISPAGLSIDRSGLEDHITLQNVDSASPFRFEFRSPTQRMFVADGPISYLCDGTTGVLQRFDGYGYQVTQIINAGLFPVAANAGRVATRLSACDIDYQPGTPQRSGLVTIALTLTDASGESIRLLHQVHVDNAP